MPSDLSSIIDAALQKLTEQRDADMFGETKPGKTFEDLKWVASPMNNPIDRRTGQPTNNPWTGDEIWAAIRPVVVARARKLAGGAFSKSGDHDNSVFEDLVQEAGIGIWKALKDNKDEGRIGNSFVTWIDNTIRSSMQQGQSAAAYYRPVRGIIGTMEMVRDAAGADAVYNDVVSKTGQVGPYEPVLLKMAENLKNAYASNDATTIKTTKRDLKKLRDQVTEAEESERSQGAFTGLHDTISVRGRQDTHNKFRQEHGRIKGLETKTNDGETIEAPDTPFEKSHVAGIGTREAARRILEIAKNGYQGPEGTIEPLSRRDFQILIRLYGLGDYPNAGAKGDTEFSVERYNAAYQALENGEAVTVQPMNSKEVQQLAQYANVDPNAVMEAFREYNEAKDTGQDPGEPVTVKVRSNDFDTMDEIAYMNAMTPWARSGRPALGPKAIKQDLGFDFSDVRLNTLINAITKGVKDRPSKKGKAGWTSELGKMLGPRIVGDAPETAAMGESALNSVIINVLAEFNDIVRRVFSMLLTEQSDIDACMPFRLKILREGRQIMVDAGLISEGGPNKVYDTEAEKGERPSDQEIHDAFEPDDVPDCEHCNDRGCKHCR